ncbi:MAG: hypothetical protein ACR2OZ_05205 [Verrucomicrobiales bacterium]
MFSCFLFSCLGAAEPEYARVSFQGRLTDAGGVVVADGSYDMVYKFYDAATEGTLLLTNRHAAPTHAVTVAGGLYTVLLGGGEIIAGSESNFWSVFLNHPQVYVGISVGTEPEMSPRLLLTRTPYAVRAEDALTLSGKPASQFLDATAVSQTKSGQLILSSALPLAILDVANNEASGIGIRSTVTGSNAALIALNQGSGSVIQGQAGPGTIVFDVANNGDTTTAGSYKFTAAKTGRITLGPADFRPRHPTEEQFILWGYPWKANRHYLICTMQTGKAAFHADVHVPEGATITKLVSYIYDIDGARSSALNLARCSLLGHTGPDPVYLVTNNSVNNQTRVEGTLNEVVNTNSSHYVLSLELFWSDLGMQFFGAQVEYTYAELKN